MLLATTLTWKSKKLVYVNLWLWFFQFCKNPKKSNIKIHILFFDLLQKIAIFFYILQQKNFIKKSKKSIKNT